MSVKEETKDFNDLLGKRLPNTSFLNTFPILSEDNEYFFNIWRSYVLNDKVIDKVLQFNAYEVDSTSWWENISYNYYESVELWWILPIVNNINNPFEELEPGTNLNMLKSGFIYQVIKEIKAISRL
jgi:hypothetical protein